MNTSEAGAESFSRESLDPRLVLANAFRQLGEDSLTEANLQDYSAKALALTEDFDQGRSLAVEMSFEREFPALAKLRGDFKDNLRGYVEQGSLPKAPMKSMVKGFEAVLIVLSTVSELREPLQRLEYGSLAVHLTEAARVAADPDRRAEEASLLKAKSKPLLWVRRQLSAGIFNKALATASAEDPTFSGDPKELPEHYRDNLANPARYGINCGIFVFAEYLKI